MGAILPILRFPEEILSQIVHHSGLSVQGRRSVALTCRLLNRLEHDEVHYEKTVRSTLGYAGAAPSSRDGTWKGMVKEATLNERAARREGMSHAQVMELYDEYADQEGWD